MRELDYILGPRVPKELLLKERNRFMIPTILLIIAASFLLISIFLPFWELELQAPQYPQGLHVKLYINKVAGDINEIDSLNHYIGMRSLTEAAPLERSLSIFMIVGIALLTFASVYIHNPLAFLLSIPAIFFPAIFLGDLFFWMYSFGTNLDPHAPLSNSVKPFVPPLLGEGYVGQFKTIAYWDIGLFMSIGASILILIGLYFHRKAYKPLIDSYFRANP